MSAPAPEISVIVVAREDEAIIRRCLAAVARGAEGRETEVIVVDNGSADDTAAVAAASDPAPWVIRLPRDAGFAAANNVGIAAASGRWLVLVNSDAFPDRGSIGRLVDRLDGDPRVGIAGGVLRYPSGRHQPSAHRFPSLAGGLWVALLLHRAPVLARLGIGVLAHPALARRPRRVDWVTAAFCAARREIGPLPADQEMYGEDVEWAARCRAAGLEVWIEPRATAVHMLGAAVTRLRPAGYANARRVAFELRWFAGRGPLAVAGARGVLALHALTRMALAGAALPLRPASSRRALADALALLRGALTAPAPRRRPSPPPGPAGPSGAAPEPPGP